MNILKSARAVAVVSVLLVLTAACGDKAVTSSGGGDKAVTSSGGGDKAGSSAGGGNAAVCKEAMQAFEGLSNKLDPSGKAGPEGLDTLNKGAAELASKLKQLSGKADGDLKATLADLGDTWANFKIDISNPAEAAKLPKFIGNVGQATQQLSALCS